jgi:hypothetical protein
MISVVVELQHEALNGSIPISDLLRKALVVARKLSLAEFQSWIELELNGYGAETKIPEYRKVHGQVQGWNPYHGWVPVIFKDAEQGEALSKRHCSQSVAELEELQRGTKASGFFHMPYPLSLQQQLSKGFGFRTEVTLFIPQTSLVRILDAVRSIVLNWALKLEEDGIFGEGMLFSVDEKEAASKAPQNITNFYGPVENPQIQQGGNKPLQVSIALDMKAVQNFLEYVRANTGNLEIAADQMQEVEAELKTVEAQMESPKPKTSIIRDSLRSLKAILENGGGAAVGQALVELGKLVF